MHSNLLDEVALAQSELNAYIEAQLTSPPAEARRILS